MRSSRRTWSRPPAGLPAWGRDSVSCPPGSRPRWQTASDTARCWLPPSSPRRWLGTGCASFFLRSTPPSRAEAVARNGLSQLLHELAPPAALGTWDPLPRSLYLWAKTVLPNYVLAAGGDRGGMANAVEGRPPFLDHHVVGGG